MDDVEIRDPRFRAAVAAIDAGDVGALRRLLAAHPELVRERADHGQGYFADPYLLWFIPENPIRTGKLAANVAEVASAIIDEARRQGVDSLAVQLAYTVELVASGRVPRERGVQLELIDLLLDAGAAPAGLMAALAHREVAAAARLIERGAPLTLVAAVCLQRRDDVARLLPPASAAERQLAFSAAALYGLPQALSELIALGVEISAYNPAGFHAHATALHHAVDSGSLAAVRVLIDAGADRGVKDRLFQGTPLEWAEHLHRDEIASYLRGLGDQR